MADRQFVRVEKQTNKNIGRLFCAISICAVIKTKIINTDWPNLANFM